MKNGGSFHSYVSHYQRVHTLQQIKLINSKIREPKLLGDPCAEFPALQNPIVWERHPERRLKGIPNHVCTV